MKQDIGPVQAEKVPHGVLRALLDIFEGFASMFWVKAVVQVEYQVDFAELDKGQHFLVQAPAGKGIKFCGLNNFNHVNNDVAKNQYILNSNNRKRNNYNI